MFLLSWVTQSFFFMSTISLYITIPTPFQPFHLLCLTVKTFFPLDHFYFYSIFKYLTLCIHVKFRTEKWEQTYDISLIKTDLTQYAYLDLFIFYAHFNEVDDCFPLSFSSSIISNNLSKNSDLSLSHLKN